MPTAKKAVTVRTNAKTKKKGSWLSNVMSYRYAKPVVTVLAFMLIGSGSVIWAMAATTTSSLWSDSTVPKTISASEGTSVELGVRFKADVAGYVTGVRFYKSAQNTGVHTGSLWDAQGKVLATVTFTNETTSGWQTAKFDKAVSVASGQVYTVSYHAPKGHFSINEKYFSKAGFVSGHLTAVGNGSGQKNGVFAYSSRTSTYPSQSGGGDNYWVDVLFSTNLINSQPAPAAPSGVTATAADSTGVQVNWQPSVSSNPVTNYTVYRNGSKLASVNTATTYTDTTVKAGTTYDYQVQATDNSGTGSALSTAVNVMVPVAPVTGSGGTTTGSGSGSGDGGSTGTGTTTGGTSSTTCPLPKYPSPSCTGVPASTTFSKTVDATSITTAGQVIDGWHVTGDLDINAAGVVIKNSQIDGTVSNDGISGSSFTISDSTVGTATCSSGGTPSLWGHDIVASRVYLRGHQDGVDMGGSNVTVSDSYFQPCFLPLGTDGFHTDGLQDLCSGACTNLTLTHNTLDSRAYYNGNAMGNSALNLGSSADGLNMRGVTLSNNLFMGGGYTTDLHWDAGANWVVSGNAWVNGSWTYSGVSTEGTCKSQTWSGNSLVTIDGNYNVTGTVATQACAD